jgi:predicted lipase
VAVTNSGLVDVFTFHDGWTGAQAFTGYNTKTNTIVLSYRGSVDMQNWIYILGLFLIDCPNPDCKGCQAHRGFLDVYNAVKSGVMASLTTLSAKYGSQQPTFLLTVHSLGASLAVLAADDVALAFANAQGLFYTYGEPRVGNPVWVLWMASSILPGNVSSVVLRWHYF